MPPLAFRPWFLRPVGSKRQSRADTGSVGNDDAGSVPSLGLTDSLQGLSVVSTHSNLSDIDVAVSGSDHTQILLANALTLSSENRE